MRGCGGSQAVLREPLTRFARSNDPFILPAGRNGGERVTTGSSKSRRGGTFSPWILSGAVQLPNRNRPLSDDARRIIAALARQPTFVGLSHDDIADFADRWELVKLSSQESLFYAGDEPDGLYLLVEGLLRVERSLRTGERLNLARIRPGAFVGELAALDPAPRSANVIAALPSVVIRLPQARLAGMADSHPAATAALLRVLSTTIADRMATSAARLASALQEPRPEATDDAENGLIGRLQRLFRGKDA